MKKPRVSAKHKPVRMVSHYPGDVCIEVYRPRCVQPHFVIQGAEADDLDPVKVSAYMYGDAWVDKGAKGWMTPYLRCDEFLRDKREGDSNHDDK